MIWIGDTEHQVNCQGDPDRRKNLKSKIKSWIVTLCKIPSLKPLEKRLKCPLHLKKIYNSIAANKTKNCLRMDDSMHTLQSGGKFSRGVTLNLGTH